MGEGKKRNIRKNMLLKIGTEKTFFLGITQINTFTYPDLSNYYWNTYLISIYHHYQIKTILAGFVVAQ